MTIKFTIYQVRNGFLFNAQRGKEIKSYIYTFEQRDRMLAHLDLILDKVEPQQPVNEEEDGEDEPPQHN